MLRRARERTRAPLVRGDMRTLPFRPASFRLAVNLFTSFGYFLDDAEHRRVIRQVAETLAPGGHFVLDYLNAAEVRRSLQQAADARRRAGNGERRREVRVTRRIEPEGRFVIKEIELRDAGRTFQERVRLYEIDELAGLFTEAGLHVAAQFGDYDGGPAKQNAPRVILVGERS
jgi:SAM-dependent methyltransferase